VYIGIDPGLSGALAVLAPDGTLDALWDTPTLTLRSSRGIRQEYDMPGLVALLAPYGGSQTQVMIEESQPMPGQGVRSMFTCGLGMGVWLGVLAALEIPHTRIRPHVWKKALGLGKDKEQARLRAMQLYPHADLRLKKHHGRAEALLLARYSQQFSRRARRASGWPAMSNPLTTYREGRSLHGHPERTDRAPGTAEAGGGG
jgi:crossover junction endodeoxyribonuclease RuvC